MKLLSICPSRDRPELCKRMLESFDLTKSEGTEILVYVSIDDPQIGKYEDLLNGRLHIFGPRRNLVQVLNYVSCELYPDIEFYQEVNDDHTYRTKDWDKELIQAIEVKGKGWGIACGNDLMTNEPWEVARHPSAALVSGNIIRTLGYFVYPEIEHLYTDTYLRDVAEGIESLFRLEDIVIEHCHFISNKAVKDDNYNQVYSSESYIYSRKMYQRWVRSQRDIDIQKLNKARKGGADGLSI